VRDIDLLPAVVEALKAQKAQQATERLKRGRGAAEAGQDYVFTGPSTRFGTGSGIRPSSKPV
jgi:hypothetical protein